MAVLLCTRRSLGILASSKGLVVGRLVIEVRSYPMVIAISVLVQYFTCMMFFGGAQHWLVIISKEHGGDTIDCSNLGSSAYPISADMNMQQRFYSDARYILVIEKV